MRPLLAAIILSVLAWSSTSRADDGAPPAVAQESGSWPAETHWYEPSNPLGLEVFDRDRLAWMAADSLGLRYTGPLKPNLAAQLRALLLETPQRFNHVVLELDSDGGDLAHVEEVVRILQDARLHMQITTRVMEGSLCASGCIPLFMQGNIRKASGASIWVFHGAQRATSGLPDVAATDRYLDLLGAAGMSPAFRAYLTADNRIYRPGSLILSGHELFAVHRAGIITELLPAWREQPPPAPTGLLPR